MATKTQYRNISAQQFDSLIKSIAPLLDAELEPLFEQVLEEGETLPDMSFVVELIRRLVFLQLDQLNEADERLVVLRARLTRYAAERDRDTAAAYDAIKRTWGSIKSSYKKVDAQAMTAIKGRLPRDPFRVWHLGLELSHNLDHAPPDLKPQLDAMNPSILRAWAKEVKKRSEACGRSYEKALGLSRQIEVAKITRDEALEEFNRIFFHGALAVEGFSGLAGIESAVREARPSRRVKGLLFVDERRRRLRAKARAKRRGRAKAESSNA